MLVLFLGFGTAFIYVTSFFTHLTRFSNLFFWFNMIIGNGQSLVVHLLSNR